MPHYLLFFINNSANIVFYFRYQKSLPLVKPILSPIFQKINLKISFNTVKTNIEIYHFSQFRNKKTAEITK